MKKKLIKKHEVGGQFSSTSILKNYNFKPISAKFENNWGRKELHKLWIDNLPPSLPNTSISTKSTDLVKKRDVGPIIPRVNNNIKTPNLVESDAVSKAAKIPQKESGTTPGSAPGSAPKSTANNGVDLEKASNVAKGIGMVADAIPRRQVDDPTINTLNSAYDATSNAIAAVPVVGTFISAGMKLIKGAEGVIDNATGGEFGIKHSGKGGFWGQYNKMSDSTWSLLTASGWINRFTKKKVEASDVDLAKSINRGYTPAEATGQEEIGGFSQSMAKFWSGQDLIKEAKQRLARTNAENLRKSSVVYGDTQARISAQNTYGDIVSKNQQQLYGQPSTRALSAKSGAKINPASLRNITKKVKAKQGTKLSFDEWYKKVPVEKNDTTLYNLRRAFELAPKEQLDEFIKNKNAHLMSAYLDPKTGIYEFVKSKKHESLNKELDWYNSKDKDAVDFRSKYKLYDDGSDYYKYVPIQQFQQGGVLNVIPEGALHARKHNLPDDIKDQVTHKGIPVVTYDDGGEITQHAEIEANEIIFSKDTTKTLEDYFKEYNKAESDSDKARIATECGKFLASEILENTDDRTGLLSTVE